MIRVEPNGTATPNHRTDRHLPGTSWKGFTLREARAPSSGELPEGFLLSHVLVLQRNGPATGEISIAGQPWMKRDRARPLQLYPALMPYELRWSGPADVVVVDLEPDFVRTVRGPETDGAPDLGEWWSTDDSFLVNAVLALAQDAREGRPAGPLCGEMIGAALVAYLLRNRATPLWKPHARSGLSPHVLRRVVEYIHENLENDLSTQSLAALAGVGIDQFLRLFKRSTQLTPHRYVLKARTERARVLLADPKLPIHEIAYRTGFADQSHFSKLFRQMTGMSPRAFRLAVRR